LVLAVIVIPGAVRELATGRQTPMTGIQTLYAVPMALGILVSITVALTLSIEGAGALYMRDQLRLLLERSRVPSPTRTPSTGAVQLPIPTEDESVLVLH
jgi:hypothetical protein